jgi:TolB-like protein/DNA-binding CsgD family transcriptional regulator
MQLTTPRSDGLSRRERQIALAYADGASHREIGARLFIAPSTVRTHLAAIYRKLGVSTKIDLRRQLSEPSAAPAAGAPTGEIAPDQAPLVEGAGTQHRASVAIMRLASDGDSRDDVADGLVQDIISRLARLRSVRVIARGSIFALAERGIADAEAARLLGVDYLASGALRRRGTRLSVSIELVATADTRIIWADSFEHDVADTFLALDAIGDKIVASLAAEIEAAERNRAILKHPQSLDAWESFHRGLWHMYRFRESDNAQAQAFFRRAVTLDPTFARAHAGLSFTHFQNAFLLHPEDRQAEIAAARAAAGDGLAADERDPAAHWAMGRALWLQGAEEEAVAELETCVALSPNFALGHYALAFVNSQSGDARAAIAAADYSRRLSPFDPLMFAMLGSRAMALVRLGAYEEAADWAVKAAARPNAHVHILAIAALCLALAERRDEARGFVALVLRSSARYRVDDFLNAFRFPPDIQARFRKAAAGIGLTADAKTPHSTAGP